MSPKGKLAGARRGRLDGAGATLPADAYRTGRHDRHGGLELEHFAGGRLEGGSSVGEIGARSQFDTEGSAYPGGHPESAFPEFIARRGDR